MKKIFITYADDTFKKQKQAAINYAKRRGNFNKCISYSFEDIERDFFKENYAILSQKRGGGYWLWKPYFILKTLHTLNKNDYLFYSDSGAIFLKKVDILIEELEKNKQDIMGFELPLIEKQWTKKELFLNLNLNEEKYRESNQIMASYILIKKTEFSMKFIQEWLDNAKKEINLTDKFDRNIIQDKAFIEHRHDQSIFSLLYKKYNLKPFKDPSQLRIYKYRYSGLKKIPNFLNEKIYNLENGRIYIRKNYNEEYNSVLFHYRKSKLLYSILKHNIKLLLFRLGLYKKIENR